MIENAIEEIKLGIGNNEDIDYYKKIYASIWSLVRWNAVTLENELFYRGRLSLDNRLFTNISELKYPPSFAVKEKGRLNDIGQSIAYLSIASLSPLIELDIDFYQIFCMIEIEYILKDIFFFSIGIKGDYDGLTHEESEFIELFNHLLTSSNKEYYNATIAFSQKIFESGLIMNETKQNVGIAYNSAQESKTNKYIYNVAIQPDVFDKCFKIKSAKYELMRYREAEDAIEVLDINNGTILDNGNIIWEKSFDEMMNYCDSVFGGDLIITTDENGKDFMIKYPEGSGKIISSDEEYYCVNFKNNGIAKINKDSR